MKACLTFCVVLSLFLAMPGCSPAGSTAQKYRLGAAGPAVLATAENYGGVDRLKSIKNIRGRAVVTSYDASGAGLVSAEEMVIQPNAGRITSIGHLPEGNWTATVALAGSARFTTTGTLRLSAEQKDRIASYLRLILHRVRGPLNLLGGSERVAGAKEVFTGGFRAERVDSGGRPDLATAYFFDTAKAELKMVTSDGVAPPEKGAVTVYSNARRLDGLMLPVRLEVRRIGGDALLGGEKILDIEFSDLSVN